MEGRALAQGTDLFVCTVPIELALGTRQKHWIIRPFFTECSLSRRSRPHYKQWEEKRESRSAAFLAGSLLCKLSEHATLLGDHCSGERNSSIGKHKGLIYATLERLDQLMAIGESRQVAKHLARDAGDSTWGFTTGKIHSYTTRTVYQEHVLRFVNWAREERDIHHLDLLDERAEELASDYLSLRILHGYSAWTLAAERSALRLFFHNRRLAEDLLLPKRRHEEITRSRLPRAHDQEFQPANWQSLILFLKACGLRREEVEHLWVQDVWGDQEGKVWVKVKRGKGGLERIVPVLPGHERDVLVVVEGRHAEEKVFPRVPKRLDIHALRREYAQAFYIHQAHSHTLPSSQGRRRTQEIDQDAALFVSKALGHHRLDVVWRYYLR